MSGRRFRILVVGTSRCYMVVPEAPGSLPWPQLLERRLRARGIDAEVDVHPEWFGLLPDGCRRWRDQLRGRGHDVVVIVYGYADLQPNLVATPVVRWATTWDKSVGTVRSGLRARVTKRVWPPLRRLGRRTADNLARSTWRVHPDVYAAELRDWLRLLAHDGAAAVVGDIPPVVGRYRYVFPGLERRRERYQAMIEAVVADAPGRAVLWRMSSIGEDHLPDALHFDAAGHDLAAAQLEACIDAVSAGRPLG